MSWLMNKLMATFIFNIIFVFIFDLGSFGPLYSVHADGLHLKPGWGCPFFSGLGNTPLLRPCMTPTCAFTEVHHCRYDASIGHTLHKHTVLCNRLVRLCEWTTIGGSTESDLLFPSLSIFSTLLWKLTQKIFSVRERENQGKERLKEWVNLQF